MITYTATLTCCECDKPGPSGPPSRLPSDSVLRIRWQAEESGWRFEFIDTERRHMRAVCPTCKEKKL